MTDMDERTQTVLEISSEILSIIQDSEEITTSDLQGCIEAQVHKAYEAGKRSNDGPKYTCTKCGYTTTIKYYKKYEGLCYQCYAEKHNITI